ncbi:hypothetical protein B0A48_17062 [Cryoendolithus antarcticus]|uniref:Uncharacterized protein n=1 Tax=Cryoendolithus antarcticus TaxID=1507870 RepID=A0A1V8SBP5_9PEZI|nr:hypothetical protein B0A48_17062 [Cryoendolithus antarcticus]
MSELGGGRASNGGARTAGPVPVPTGTPTGLKTPRDVMRERQEREARRQGEAREEARQIEEKRRLEEKGRVEERRRSGDRRARQTEEQAGSRLSGSGQVPSGDVYGIPTGRMATTTGDSGYVSAGPSRRAASASVSQDQPRPVQAASSARPRTQSAAAAPRQPIASSSQQQQGGAASSSSQAQAAPAAETSQQPRNSSFPHAFERWEQLSSHWEGLTSYWLRKLEMDAEEIQRSVPSASAMSRQITDLSAAGANLFHAVVELQRLRASSERKFQRWFFETRAENERAAEVRAGLEAQLQLERSERQKATKTRGDSDIAAENARREVAEMRRELMISKEEARRAWEELGRRNEESLNLASSLKEGRVTYVSGVQVVPYAGGPSRTGSASQRPTTRDGLPRQQYGSTPGITTAGAAVIRSPGDEEAEAYYQQQDEDASPTNTDPFTETSKPALHHEPGVQSLAAGTYAPQSSSFPLSSPRSGAKSAASVQTAIRPNSSQPQNQQSTTTTTTTVRTTTSPSGTQTTQSFYAHPPQQTFLHSPNPSAPNLQPQQQPSSSLRPPLSAPSPALSSEASEGLAEEYIIDSSGTIQRDAHGQPILYRRAAGRSSDSSDPAPPNSRFSRGQVPAAATTMLPAPEAPRVAATAGEAMQGYRPTASGSSAGAQQQQVESPDYEGDGYEGWEELGRGDGRGGLSAGRHHHPTRLSDVLEEEEERSSRRSRVGGD